MGINLVFLALLVATCAYALLRGGAPERIGAGIFAAGSVLTLVVVSIPSSRYRAVELGVLAVDIATFVAFVVLALRANRFWPIWVSALLGVGVVGHLAKFISPQVIPWAYQVALTIWSYPILLLVCLGTWMHRQRLAGTGADPSWMRSLRRSGRTTPRTGQLP